MKDSQSLESQNPRPNKDKKNITNVLTVEKFITTINNKTD